MECPWGCDSMTSGGKCRKCRFRFAWLVECGWREESSKVNVVKKRLTSRYVAPTRDFKDYLCIEDGTGKIRYSARPMPEKMSKWNQHHRIMKSEERIGWNITDNRDKKKSKKVKKEKKEKKRKVSPLDEVPAPHPLVKEKKQKLVYKEDGPTPLSLEKVEKLECRAEVASIMSSMCTLSSPLLCHFYATS